ncbi:MAG: 4-hydroxythreonine-4-phosphate dehydrogenase PdxA [Bacteroidia bacterium]|nr:4-hydroxythreonine-4-phosphate dehydrogenase PdxA [Bacteroidia bacterium]MCZ2248594.1 4-hydroxythreonine-4-phosphate dehydrogenase PdxA [Bacteroidia bacterium]
MSKVTEQDFLPKIGITCGDINGVGLEVAIKTFADNRMMQSCTPIIYCHAKTAVQYRKNLHIAEFGFHQIKHISELSHKNVNLYNILDKEVPYEPGKSTKEAGQLALASIKAAINDIKSGAIDAIVTAPINKDNIQSEGFNFAGHTEYFAHEFKVSNHLMFLISDHLKIGTVTGHVPINQVAVQLSTEKIINKVKLMADSLLTDFGIRKPRIAVLGLNPHAGDNGVIGNEEKDIIIPAVQHLKEAGYIVYGPYGADGFFGSGTFNKFDAVLSMYHDQGLIPFKTLAFESGVNYTAGLPFVRTSPDHGTAYDLAGKNIASESSFRNAVYAALDILFKRRQYAELTANPLKISVQKRERER